MLFRSSRADEAALTANVAVPGTLGDPVSDVSVTDARSVALAATTARLATKAIFFISSALPFSGAHRFRGAQTLPEQNFTCGYHIIFQTFPASQNGAVRLSLTSIRADKDMGKQAFGRAETAGRYSGHPCRTISHAATPPRTSMRNFPSGHGQTDIAPWPKRSIGVNSRLFWRQFSTVLASTQLSIDANTQGCP